LRSPNDFEQKAKIYASKSMENILVAGANGSTGRIVVNLLMDSSAFNPIAMVRRKEQEEFFKKQNIQTVLGDLEKDLSHTVKNIDRVIFAAGSGGQKVVEVDQKGAQNLVDESVKGNIKKFVMLSSMGAEQPDKAGELKAYLWAKHNADQYLKASGLKYTIVRPGALTDQEATNEIQLAPKLNMQGEISRADVAQTLVNTLLDELAPNLTFEIINGEQAINQSLVNLTNDSLALS
jgi:uncharacterized protein YbjT (DUF2867 family)